jgi:DNA-binding NarL/FixJ family response regulator
MLTMHDDDESIFGAVRAGALGYVLKGADSDDLLRAIAAVAAGEAIFGPGLARRALQALSAPREPAFAELTRREREVLELIASGMSNPGIAAKLGLSPNTVSKPHLEHLQQTPGGDSVFRIASLLRHLARWWQLRWLYVE